MKKNQKYQRKKLTKYFKYIYRSLKSNYLRIFAVGLVIAIGICITTGLYAFCEKIDEGIKIMDLDQYQISIITALSDKIKLISYIFPIFFIGVASLTILMTLIRYLEEERSNMACLKTLGYNNFHIMIKYLLFAIITSLIGSIIGIISGVYGLLPLLYQTMVTKFSMVEPKGLYIQSGIIWSLIMMIAMIISALVLSIIHTSTTPVQMQRPKAPKPGKKILLEKIKFIWNPLKFKYKSTMRNVFRYKIRLFMTVISVIGATGLIFCGLGLKASLDTLNNQPADNLEGLIDSILPITIAIIICAISLAIIVIFNLTNINIEERKKEIATLKVLGYFQNEVSGYIYREIFILALMGIILGLPIGYGFLGFIFDYLDFGKLSAVEYDTWLFTFGLAIACVVIADIILYPKIAQIEMTSSLKAID